MPLAHDYCRSGTIKTPPFTVREQVALLARVDGVSEQLRDFPGLREIFAPVRFDQLDHQLRTLPRAPLIGALLTEAGLPRDRVLQPRDPALERRVRKHHPRERAIAWGAISAGSGKNTMSGRKSATVMVGLRPLIPVGPRIRADSAADRADHARAEGGHRHAIGKAAHVQSCGVIAPNRAAGDCQRAHVVFTHIAEGHHGTINSACTLRLLIF